MGISDAAQAPGKNRNIYFTDSLLIKGTDILHPMNTGCFSLVASGTYEISYHTIGTNASVLNTPVLVGVHLTANHDVIPGTTSLATVSLEDQKVDLSGTARIMTEDVTYAILAGDAFCRPLKHRKKIMDTIDELEKFSETGASLSFATDIESDCRFLTSGVNPIH